MAVLKTPRELRAGYAPASRNPDPEAGQALNEKVWRGFEQRRHRMQPPDLFDEATKKFEKYAQTEEAASSSKAAARKSVEFPELPNRTDAAAVHAAASTSARASPEQRQVDANLGMRKARFFDRCLRADRALESPRRHVRSPPPAPIPVMDAQPSVEDPPESFTPRMSTDHWGNGTFRSSSLTLDRSDSPRSNDAEEVTLSFAQSVDGLVDHCRHMRLHPATTGIIRAEGNDRLQLEYGFLTDERAEAMNDTLRAASSDVKEASFRSNGLTEKGASSLLMALPPSIEHVDLSQNDLSHGEVWCKAFKQLPQLRTLVLADCQLPDNVCREVIRSLLNCKRLERLDLSGNCISAAGTTLRSLVKAHRSLRELDLHWNHFSGEGARSLVLGLLDNSKADGSLHTVNLSFNPLGKVAGEDTCIQLAKLFAETTVLRHMDLSKCELSADCCRILADGMKENTSLMGLHISGNEARLDPLGLIVPNPPRTSVMGVKPSSNEAHVDQSVAPNPPGAFNPVQENPGSGGLDKIYGTGLEMEFDRCCWQCERWRETRLSYVPVISGPDSPDVWVFTAIDGFASPIKMTRLEEEFVAYVMAAPGPLRYFFQAGKEVLCSRTAQQVNIDDVVLGFRAGVGLYSGSCIAPEKEAESGGLFLRVQRARLPGEQLEDENPENQVSLDVQLNIFNTMMIVARPPDEPICLSYMPRRIGELQGDFQTREWSIEQSLFAPHHEALSIRAFCERCFELDWARAGVGRLARDDADNTAVKDTLKTHYAEIKVLYSSLCSVDYRLLQMPPEDRPRELAFGVGLHEFTHMLVQHNLVGEELLSLEDADAQFVAAAVPPVDTAGWHAAFCMEGQMVQRHGFFGLLVRLAASLAKVVGSSQSKSKSKSSVRVSKTLQTLLNKHIMYPYPPMKNNFRCVQWRVDVLQTQEVEAVFRKHMKDVVDPLFMAFSRGGHTALGPKRHLRPEDWFHLLDALHAFPVIADSAQAQINVWDRTWLWQVSAMTQIDETRDLRCIELAFVEFLEALARLVGLMKSRQRALESDVDDDERWQYGLDHASAPSVFCLHRSVLDKGLFAQLLDEFLVSDVVKQALKP
eukprot:TRINITY_DN72577_c0_g1_i1.p1 TRINITY_DN72577_c0_g1~~TRINITY_DN72577_c0_g1_i1.p1  ORF type:complete len:1091 (-),score=204.41 TRINITY_DN72577_c0_g1_i1:564-3836(-)